MAVKPRLSKADWLSLGLAELSGKGSDAVKLDAICKAAGVTKGSFYHHFGNHQSFLTELAVEWRERQTRALLPGLDGLEPDDAAQELTELAAAIDYRMELGIRELARRIPEVAEIVRQTDIERRDCLAAIYQARFSCSLERARQLAWMEYATFSGLILLEPDAKDDAHSDLARFFDQMTCCFFDRGGT